MLQMIASEERPTAASEAAWPHHGILSLFVVLWGSNFVLAEVALRDMTPLSFSAARFLVGGAALLALLTAERAWKSRGEGDAFRLFPPLRRRDGPRLLAVAVLGGTLAPWLGIVGLEHTGSGHAALWLALGPALSVGLGLFLGTERVGRSGLAGVVLAGAGTLLLGAEGLRFGRSYVVGDLLLLGAISAATLELHLIKPLAARYGKTPVTAASTGLGGLLYGLVALPSFTGEPWAGLGTWAWIAILAGGAVGVGLGRWVKVRALRKLGPTRVVVYGNLVPFATLLVAWLALGDAPSVLEVGAGFLIAGGSTLLQVSGVAAWQASGKHEAAEEREAFDGPWTDG